MTKYVFVGHGSFAPETGTYLPEILIPPDTTLQFFSDAGQALILPTGDGDYTDVASVWAQLKDEGSPIQPKGVTYNFRLSPDSTEKHRESALKADWGSGVEVKFVSSDYLYMCTCSPTETDPAKQCPTPALNVEARQGTVGDEQWKHHCNGILGQYGGNGNELYWIACTSFRIHTPELPVLDTAAVSGPGTSDVSKWEPDADDYTEMTQKNKTNLERVKAEGSVAIAAGGVLVLIGEDHERRPADYVRRQSPIEEGLLTIAKAGAFGPGPIEVRGITTKKATVESELAKISNRKVTFIPAGK